MPEETTRTRLLSLDVFRGITIAGMVLVNNPGTWSAIYGPLKHAEWHGITPTDYIFPFFLFIVGVAIPMALTRRIETGITRDVYFKIVSRSITIFLVSLIISALPFFNYSRTEIPDFVKIAAMLGFSAALFFYLWEKPKTALIMAFAVSAMLAGLWLAGFVFVPYDIPEMRIPGVLQRIAVCYLVVSLLFLHTNWKQQAMIGGGLLLVYWFLITAIPVPGCEITTMDDKACNLAAYLDRLILGEAHIWDGGKVYDPEGILSTLPALVTTIAGVLTGTWLTAKRGDLEKVSGLFFFGVVLVALGWMWGWIFPINKALWTSSYVLYTSGLALCFLGFCYWLIDIKGYKRWAKPFIIFGVNALALYVFSGIFARMLGMIKVTAADGSSVSLQSWIFDTFFLSIASPINASLMFAVSFILFWLFLMWLLYRRRIYIKV
ncbi:MAG: DUF5009 domain-containing protein [Saprospiraceae bacterium]|nr:DUF5009 domain-containing protein [Pyrinomonadaceae bacterium]